MEIRDFPGDPVVKVHLANAGNSGLIPDQGPRIPHASGQLRPICLQLLSPCDLELVLFNQYAAVRPSTAKKQKQNCKLVKS